MSTTISEKLDLLLSTKEDIKSAIIEKGQEVADTDPFSSYPDKIRNIAGSGLDTSDATATASDILLDKTAYVDGEKITGTIQNKGASDLILNGDTVFVPQGYFPSSCFKTVEKATQATPTISVSSTGLITASATQTEGYVAAGTKSATSQLSTQSSTTITPSTSNKTAVAANKYTTGVVTVKGDANLVPANIKSGVSIFGVTGSAQGKEYVPIYLYNPNYATSMLMFFIDQGGTYTTFSGMDSYREFQILKDSIFLFLAYNNRPIQYVGVSNICSFSSATLNSPSSYALTYGKGDLLAVTGNSVSITIS